MINWDNAQKLPNKFGGSEKKGTVLYGGSIYMLKYPDPIREQKRKDIISYKNNQYSEHVGSSIFSACGIEAQETALGYYTDPNGKTKIVVGCKDFTQRGKELYEIDKLANDVALDETALDTTVENVSRIIDETESIKDKQDVKNAFWDMFVMDALIGNKDRHFGNWGVLEQDGKMSFAPVYDCGSSLSALVSDEEMQAILTDPINGQVMLKAAEYNIASVYKMNGKRILYHEIFKNPPSELSDAIKRMVPKIDMEKIKDIVDSTEEISGIRKEYLKKSMSLRYEEILKPSLKRVLKLEKVDYNVNYEVAKVTAIANVGKATPAIAKPAYKNNTTLSAYSYLLSDTKLNINPPSKSDKQTDFELGN